MTSVAVSWAVGVVDAATIDLLGLTAAGDLAMRRAVLALNSAPDFALVDAFTVSGLDCPQRGIVFGDARCLSIAAASIIAKVYRDGLLEQLDRDIPGYGFARHKGYGTREHQAALTSLGPSPEHRLSYAPVKAHSAPAD